LYVLLVFVYYLISSDLANFLIDVQSIISRMTSIRKQIDRVTDHRRSLDAQLSELIVDMSTTISELQEAGSDPVLFLENVVPTAPGQSIDLAEFRQLATVMNWPSPFSFETPADVERLTSGTHRFFVVDTDKVSVETVVQALGAVPVVSSDSSVIGGPSEPVASSSRTRLD
jgi:hypothetical protein